MRINLKSVVLAALLSILCFNNIYSEESGNNMIYGGISVSALGMAYGLGFLSPQLIFGISLEYERLINDGFTIALDAGIDPTLIPYAEIKGRWYPWSNVFYLGLGTGIWGFIPISSHHTNDGLGFSVSLSPTIGWRIDAGENYKWYIMPNITSRFLIYTKNTSDRIFFTEAIGDWLIAKFSVGYRF